MIPKLVVIVVMTIGYTVPCNPSSPYYSALHRARARAARTSPGDSHGVTSLSHDTEVTPLSEDYATLDPCQGVNYVPFTAIEMRAVTALSSYPDEPQLSVEEGGRLTCSFDNPQEYCSWYNVPLGHMRFWQGRHEVPFDMPRFQCTSPRSFDFDGIFLLAGGEPTMGPQKVALETVIPCQYDEAILKFDFWTNSDEPVLRYCILKSAEEVDMECQDILPMQNPINFSLPVSVNPFRVRLEVLNMGMRDIVLIDNIYYEGMICQVVPDEDDDSSITKLQTTTGVAGSSQETTKSENWFLGNGLFPSFAAQGSSTFGGQEAIPLPAAEPVQGPSTSPQEEEPVASPTSELSVCEALTCDFNDDHSCYYGLSGIGSTAPWSTSHVLVGNRHTGIQRVNLKDSQQVGFAYVGADGEAHVDDIYVMESPKFTSNTNIYLIFDIYLRSKGPRLKLCLDSFDYCPYQSPPLDPQSFWHSSQKVFIPPGVKKVYFIAENVGKNLFLAIDNLRVEAEDGSAACPEPLL